VDVTLILGTSESERWRDELDDVELGRNESDDNNDVEHRGVERDSVSTSTRAAWGSVGLLRARSTLVNISSHGSKEN